MNHSSTPLTPQLEAAPTPGGGHDTRTDGEVKVKKRKKRQKKLFKLPAMNQLVDENGFLKTKYDALAENGEDKLGYHWNEAVQTILFNKYVKPDKQLMGRYLQIKRLLDVEGVQDNGKPTKPDQAPADKASPAAEAPPAPEAPAPDPELADPEQLLAATPAAEAPAPDDNQPVDTRITAESTDTLSAGNYQHSGPLVTSKGGMAAFMSHWKSKVKQDGLGMTLIAPNRKQHTMGLNAFKTLTESGMNPLANPALLENLLAELAPAAPLRLAEDKKPDALIQIERLHQETEKASNGYYKKEQKERNLNMQVEADGTQVQQHDYEPGAVEPGDVKKHHPSEKEEEFVKLNRGGNLADRAIQGVENMDPDFLARMKDEAGKDVVAAAEDKAEQVKKAQPGLAPPARVETLAEGLVLSGRYQAGRRGQVVAFQPARAQLLAEGEAVNFTRLETKGLGNDATPGAKTLIESHDFYIDLDKNAVYCQPKGKAPLNEGVVTVAKADFDRLRQLISYRLVR